MTMKTFKFSVLSLFYIALVLHGLQRMSGLFIIELSKGTKNITHQDAAVPFIYSWAVAKIVASLSHFLTGSKSSDLLVFCGVLLCTIGAALCILDTDITAITVFWGFIFGSGYGLASPHLTRAISHKDSSEFFFFQEIPSSFGVSFMPFLLEIIVLQYGLQGSFIIFSGVILQYLPFALAATYNTEIRIPNIKWRVRKKNSQYYVSKQEAGKAISIECFNNSLEPDFVLKGNQCNDYYQKINRNNPVIFSKEKFRAERKRSETKGNDLQGLEIQRKELRNHKIQYPAVPEIENDEENGEKMSKKSFNKVQVIDTEAESKEIKDDTIFNSEMIYNVCGSDKNSMNISERDLELKNKIQDKISHNIIKETEPEKEESSADRSLENNTLNDQNISDLFSIKSKTLFTNKDKENNHQINENLENEGKISFITKQVENKSLTSQKLHNEKLPDKETLLTQSLQSLPIFTIPLDIKVHVEEYTFAVDREYRSNSFNSSYSEDITNDEINNSEYKFLQKNECIHIPNRKAPQNILKNSDKKDNLSNIYSVSKQSKFDSTKRLEKSSKAIGLNIRNDELKLKFIRILKFFNNVISPVCLCIVLITIIFETSLVTLLTNTNDFLNTTDRTCSGFTWILVAFGVGGLFGKLCCFKISKTISKKSHTVGVILFLLTGLSIAGVLYSPNLSWLAGFYGILGAIEGGISYTLPKFILDYTHKEVHDVISSLKNFLSGIVIISLPSIIGSLSDEMGDYEFLLQTLSCLSVLCALLAYILPYLRSISEKRTIPIF